MTQKTVSGKTVIERLFHWMDINPLFKIDNAAKAIEIVFDFPKIASEKPLKRKSMEIIMATLEVDYETALNKVVDWIRTHPNFEVDDGVESLAVVFDITGKVARKDIVKRMK
ncbi:hypothetical protein KAU33_04395 [Candidatus Dependentiae bacterium]|nr:hypothetical protein [Candidatus Dependentiae bacterium]